ncbi:hypothetical protein [Deinococcus kurensis]|uniref:hypothetical protein n=1 Tax=Deinococcus kurensis TaxID=2662757 RepID=UPI0012D35B6F|nr:hypothetical protein [Deinococcus kurensis]
MKPQDELTVGVRIIRAQYIAGLTSPEEARAELCAVLEAAPPDSLARRLALRTLSDLQRGAP